jgi:hypothetical protein
MYVQLADGGHSLQIPLFKHGFSAQTSTFSQNEPLNPALIFLFSILNNFELFFKKLICRKHTFADALFLLGFFNADSIIFTYICFTSVRLVLTVFAIEIFYEDISNIIYSYLFLFALIFTKACALIIFQTFRIAETAIFTRLISTAIWNLTIEAAIFNLGNIYD